MKMITKTSKLFAIALAVAGLVACSSKGKKKTTAPQAKASNAGPSKAETAGSTSSSTDKAGDPIDGTVKPSLAKVIYFEFDSSELSEDARQQLTNNATWMKQDAKRTLRIEGHTDERGTPEYNVALGERRARIAKEFLVRMGIEGKRIKIITYGEEKPASNEDAENRRSVFIATK